MDYTSIKRERRATMKTILLGNLGKGFTSTNLGEKRHLEFTGVQVPFTCHTISSIEKKTI